MIFIGAVADLSVYSVVSEIRFIRVVTLTDC